MALALFVALILMVFLRVAAPHQYPYWLVLGPFLAILVAANPGPLPWVLAALGLMTAIPQAWNRVGDLREDLMRTRAVDVALELAGEEDAIWLVSPARQPDDDKTATSDVLWRFSPWRAAPPWRGVDFEYVDPRYGQPRVFGRRIVHSSVDIVEGSIEEGCQRSYLSANAFETAVKAHLNSGRQVWVVLYDHGPACDMPGGMDWAMRTFQLGELSPEDASSPCRWVGEDRGLGQDRLCLIEGVL
jgi:hypothetical protein